jgi:mRNA-degrading endonuclease toxin of MazEF toxin-antitoxin module
MEKDFDGWNERKKTANARRDPPFCHERELWWCTLGLNVGSEQDGSGDDYRRPVLVLKGLSIETCLVIPLTTSARRHPLRPAIGMVAGKNAHALLSQMRVIDTKRLVRKIGRLDQDRFTKIREAAKGML